MSLTQFIVVGLVSGGVVFLLLLGYRYLQVLERRRYADPIDPATVWQDRREIPICGVCEGCWEKQSDGVATNHIGLRIFRGKYYCDDCHLDAVELWREECAD